METCEAAFQSRARGGGGSGLSLWRPLTSTRSACRAPPSRRGDGARDVVPAGWLPAVQPKGLALKLPLTAGEAAGDAFGFLGDGACRQNDDDMTADLALPVLERRDGLNHS